MNKEKIIEIIEKSIANQTTKIKYFSYIENCYTKNIPIIFNLDHFQKILGIKKEIILSILFSDKYYREFTIPKRNGKLRKIDAPYPVLLMIQRWILDNILSTIVLNSAATGFIKNKSIKDNAFVHIGTKCLLKMDIKDFFPSVSLNRIICIFENLGYPHKISYFLAKLCCKDNCLPQGSPTSPYISNIIAKRLDIRLKALSKKCNLVYTRYADDITFSGDYISSKYIKHVYTIITSEGFIPNFEKTRLVIGNGKKIITGLSISNDKLTIPRKKKRELRKNAFYILLNGLEKYSQITKKYDPIFLERLIGKYTFWKFIEPDNEHVIKTLNKLVKYSNKL
jgi:hypothetical protein